MSKLTEYLALIPKALGNPKEVMDGWLNVIKEELGTLSPDLQEEVLRRRLICGTCPFMSVNAKELQGYQSKRVDEHCILCACPIKAKTANPDSICGAKYYNETHPKEQPLEVRWTKYEGNEG